MKNLSTSFPAGVITQYEARKSIRATQAFKNRNQAWGRSKMGWWQAAGYVMDTMREHKPQSFEEWVEVYFTHCKSWEEVKWAGMLWGQLAGIGDTAGIGDFIIHIIDETWEGACGELLAEELIKVSHHGFDITVRDATKKEDLDYAVDFVVSDANGSIKTGYQVKPNSFFVSPRISKDRAKYVEMNRRFMSAFNADVFYLNIEHIKRGEFLPIELSDIVVS